MENPYILVCLDGHVAQVVPPGGRILVNAPGAEPLPVSEATAIAVSSLPDRPDPRTMGFLTWDDIRLRRDPLLSASDYTVLSDAPLTTAQKAAWKAYRKSLRELTDGPDPNTITWPTAPNETGAQ